MGIDVEAPELKRETPRADADMKDLVVGASVNFVGKLARSTRGVFLFVVGWLCGLDVVGDYSLSWGIVATLNKVARFGLLRGVVRFAIGARADGPREAERVVAAALRIGLLTSVAVAVGLTLAAEAIAAYYQKPIADAVRIMAWSAPFLTAAWVFLAAIRSLRLMHFEVYVMAVAGPLILLAGGLAIGLAGFGLTALAWVQLGVSAAACLLASQFFRRFYSLGNSLFPSMGGRDWRGLIRFSLPVMLTDLMYGLLTQLDVLMLAKFVSSTEVGIYSLARRIADAMLKAPQAFDPIFSSVVSDLSNEDRHDELGHRFVVISRWVLTINLPIFAALFIVGDSLLGSEVETAVDLQVGFQILLVLCIGKLAQGAFALVEPLLAMSGRPTLNMYNNGVWLGGNFLLNIWLIDRYGVFGAAVGATAAIFAVNAIRMVQIRFIHGIRPFERSQIKPVAAAGAAALAAWLARGDAAAGLLQSSAGPLALFLVVYVLALRLLGLEAEDRALLGRLVARLKRGRGADQTDSGDSR
jgi:O-antigen/teichoic acid export membrane protein